jgi:hypothetical protein
VSVEAWEDYAAMRLATRNGDEQLAWRDLLGATALLSRVYTSRDAMQSVDAAVAGFYRALEPGGAWTTS